MSQASALRHATSTVARAPGRPNNPAARLRVVPAAIEQTGTGKFAAICMMLLTVGLLTLLLLNTQLAQGSFTLHDLQVASGTLSDQEHELTRALDAERNPGALAKRALDMGMVPATSMAFIRLEDGAILGVAEPAAPKTLAVVSSPKVHASAPAPVISSPAPADAVASDPDVPEGATVTPAVTPAVTPTVTPAVTPTVPAG